jgi:hypothetical protein
MFPLKEISLDLLFIIFIVKLFLFKNFVPFIHLFYYFFSVNVFPLLERKASFLTY